MLSLQSSLSREKNRMESMVKEKDAFILKQKAEIDRLSSCLTSTSSSEPSSLTSSAVGATGLDRHRPGAGRVHGSFRQFKRDKQQTKSSSTSKLDAGCSSEESSGGDSPVAAPKKPRPPLRLSLSTPADAVPLTSTSSSSSADSSANNSLSYPKKGILKASSSYGSLDSQTTTSILANLQKLITTAAEKPAPVKKLSVSSEERSDSGRESDEAAGSPTSQPKSLLVNNMKMTENNNNNNKSRRFNSANSSFDSGAEFSSLETTTTLISSTPLGNDGRKQASRLSIRGSSSGLKPKEKPKPPPRSSTTKLTTTMATPEKKTTVINIVKKEAEKKRVKFNPVMDFKEDPSATMERNAIKLLEQSIMNYKPGEKHREQKTSYFEPYL